ncbi:MAG: 4-alpha-glucanotransferase [Candidatus Desantisbacteria bacterium]
MLRFLTVVRNDRKKGRYSMQFSRSSGILLHPTSLPARFGIGDMSIVAYRFVDFLAGSGQKLWQILPLGPTGYGNSPYNSFSAFAGNPLLISLDELVKDGLLQQADITNVPAFPENYVDYSLVIEYKMAMFHRSFERFKNHPFPDFEGFCMENQAWLDDYSLFMALKESYGESSWNKWDKGVSRRKPEAIQEASHRLADSILFQKYLQYIFFKQWSSLKRYANDRHIKIIGDIPIFVSYNSSDVWSQPEMFMLDDKGKPTVVAGVPPDYFSRTGQLWGNPLYRWDIMAQRGSTSGRGYDWWIKRIKVLLKLVDIIRIDHFRGFEAYWEVPAKEKTAINGRWVKGPGAEMFTVIEQSLGKLPLIAEDLGVITPEVEALRDQFAFPGMKILHFAFGSESNNPYLPHNYTKNCVVYTGTHDNDTTMGWFTKTSSKAEHEHALKYLGKIEGNEKHWEFIRLALSSVADMAIIPLQDVLGLGGEARMNIPGKALGNWSWRYTQGMMNDECQERLRELTGLYGRG